MQAGTVARLLCKYFEVLDNTRIIISLDLDRGRRGGRPDAANAGPRGAQVEQLYSVSVSHSRVLS